MGKSNVVAKKRFIISKSMIGQGLKVEVETRTGNTFTYDHDQIYSLFKETMTVWCTIMALSMLTGIIGILND